MKADIHRLESLHQALGDLLERETGELAARAAALAEACRELGAARVEGTPRRLERECRELAARLAQLGRLAGEDLLAKARAEAALVGPLVGDARLAAVVGDLLSAGDGREAFCSRLLDRLVEATGAERGFVVFYVPASTEAEVAAARDFASRNLSLEEYRVSRTLLAEVLAEGRSLLLADAASDPGYSRETSVRRLGLRSVLAVPMQEADRCLGAIYLEHGGRAGAFDAADLALVEHAGRIALAWLRRGDLLPPSWRGEERVFLDGERVAQELVGRDPKLLELKSLIARLADSPATVLVSGESGTGKELVARALHYASRRCDGPFVAVNCAAIPETLLESELFGHERGAFTGATQRSVGRFEQAQGGTLFLDEVSELALPLQAKLLRFLQLHEFDRLGGREPIRVDVRVVAATSKDLKAMTAAGAFQEALYYRLSVVPLRVPSLRERPGDIPVLLDHFLARFAALYGRPARFEREVVQRLAAHSFPGNVRELENLVHRMVALSPDGVVRASDLPAELQGPPLPSLPLDKTSLGRALASPPGDLEELRRRREQVGRLLAAQERELARRAVEAAGGNVSLAARQLGLHRVTLHRLLQRGSDGGRSP
jgi:DNA-binding NtrC family response regulator/GAF domain-containing protein